MKKTRRFLSLLMVVTVMMVFGEGATEDTHQRQERKFSVGVVITCDDKNMKASIESYIIQELWRLQDVSLVDKKDAKYLLYLMLLKPELSIEANDPDLSVHVPEVFVIGCNYLTRATELQKMFQAIKTRALQKKILMDQQDRQMLDAFDTLHNHFFHFPTLSLTVSDKNDLEETCKELIADFDSLILE
ncbi:hypothetical protein F4055_13205, partial [Candidatus Poribacteria bacterium]|nr:hypothetical protein [Candidatus Poribacteria bacterium]